MKVRVGFVSNSSSSSFVVGAKKMPTKAKLVEIFGVPKDSPLYDLSVAMASVIVDSLEERTKEEVIADWGYEEGDDLPKEYNEVWKRGLKLFEGSVASDSDDYAELALVEVGLDYKSDDLIIYKEAGY